MHQARNPRAETGNIRPFLSPTTTTPDIHSRRTETDRQPVNGHLDGSSKLAAPDVRGHGTREFLEICRTRRIVPMTLSHRYSPRQIPFEMATAHDYGDKNNQQFDFSLLASNPAPKERKKRNEVNLATVVEGTRSRKLPRRLNICGEFYSSCKIFITLSKFS
ncbi:hypothetical protein B0H19DRAFT_1080129 [Mycena capillaripes]|nr:hypothetical protein B0H19DRAFT_1080129 [Mycena capillaripes]